MQKNEPTDAHLVAIRHVKSCKCTQIVQHPELRSEFRKPGEPTPRMESVSIIYWLASGSSRDEQTTFPQTWKGSPEWTSIVSAGLSEVCSIQAYDPDPAYNGKMVGPNDKDDKVLLRWKLDDGRYEVIFGDLRAETVTAERLHDLEGK